MAHSQRRYGVGDTSPRAAHELHAELFDAGRGLSGGVAASLAFTVALFDIPALAIEAYAAVDATAQQQEGEDGKEGHGEGVVQRILRKRDRSNLVIRPVSADSRYDVVLPMPGGTGRHL
jgi:hypothetical protein